MKKIFYSVFITLIFFTVLIAGFKKDINTGNKFFYKNKYDEAIEKYNQAEIKKPDSFYVYYNRGNTFYKQQNYDLAIQEYNKSLGLTKDKYLKSKVLFNLGNTYLKLSDTEKAKNYYKQALLLNPNDEEIKYNLKYTLIEKKDKQKSNQNSNNQQKKEENKKNYMSNQDMERLTQMIDQNQKEKLKEVLNFKKSNLDEVEKDW